jgi:hypothetical protein
MARERWSVKVDAGDVATLDIPADLQRDRDFEIDCRFVVRARPGADAPWHAMRVSVDGSLEWSRRIATSTQGDSDSLDYHFRRSLPRGQALRVVATTQMQGAQRLSLAIEAEAE